MPRKKWRSRRSDGSARVGIGLLGRPDGVPGRDEGDGDGGTAALGVLERGGGAADDDDGTEARGGGGATEGMAART